MSEQDLVPAVPIPEPVKSVSVGWVEALKEKLHLQEIYEKFDITSGVVADALIFLVVGFLGGFLLKKYVRYAIIAIVALFLAIKGLESIGVISIDWIKFQTWAGLQPTDTVDSVFSCCTQWVKENVIVTVSFLLGFLVGMRFG